ncbi:unnamed protein product [Calicophoron daubneyi]|uniref:C2H2-type domain-containing protein n=1 Tax=Calicophoron daubneyi TaxID=300641 RepID=A0AAV2T2F7_CALDB
MTARTSGASGNANDQPSGIMNDFYLSASSVRLPFLAAGLVNSAVAMLFTQLSTRFFEMAILDPLRDTKEQELDQKITSVVTDQISQPAERGPTDSHAPLFSKTDHLSTESPGEKGRIGNNTSLHSPVGSNSLSPIHLIPVKTEDVNMDYPSIYNSLIPHPNDTYPDTNVTTANEQATTSDLILQAHLISPVDYLKRYPYCSPGCSSAFPAACSHKQLNPNEKPCSSNCECHPRFLGDSLLLHQNEMRKFAGQFTCSFPRCGKIFLTHDRLVEHIRAHTGERPYACDYPGCSYRFARRGNLFAHKRVHLDKAQRRQYHCSYPGCGKFFLYMRSLSEHMNVHLGQRPYSCDYPNCNKRFTSKSYLCAHRRIHLGSGIEISPVASGIPNLPCTMIQLPTPLNSSSGPSVTSAPATSQADSFPMSSGFYGDHIP